jgi:putative endonuclease
MGRAVETERSTVVRGASAETRAAEALTDAGYEIMERNFRCKGGELDIIARDGDILVFVEVRSRVDGTHGHAAEMVTASKRGQVTRVARIYLQARRPVFDECRFDVVAVTGATIDILKDAWRAGGT